MVVGREGGREIEWKQRINLILFSFSGQKVTKVGELILDI